MNIFISEKNFIHNINLLKNRYNKDVIPVIKANAYGHDINLISKLLLKYKINICAVARISEALEILEYINYNKNFKILIFESIEYDFLKTVIKNPQLLISANSLEDLYLYLKFGISSNQIQLKIDFGFGRNGIYIKDINLLKELMIKYNLKFSGIFTHLFSVEYKDGVDIINKFTEIVENLGKNNFQMIHLQNSLGITKYGSIPISTHLRPGMFVFGFYEEGAFENNLQKVFSLEGKVINIKDISSLKYLTYNQKKDLSINLSKVAIIKIGYGDGFLKTNEGSLALINNQKFKIISVMMDSTLIEIDDTVHINDTVKLYFDFSLIRDHLKMNMCEVLSLLSHKIPRILI
ncbi:MULTISPECIES: alanine racemase [Fusobacterium]|uniref:alanine racemase n=1 Tax=Fusobacterium TaxID=848 RepID=UPI001476D32D|nr:MULTISPECIES: alanine racemase [Fusobacterium]NME36119.1 alanine racemase [Fusobacterium sp. FSA-380-WT-3A]